MRLQHDSILWQCTCKILCLPDAHIQQFLALSSAQPYAHCIFCRMGMRFKTFLT